MIKGVLLDYGGTIDTNGLHWGYVLWQAYQKYELPVDQAAFEKAYAFGERSLALEPLVKPTHNFQDVLRLKTAKQFSFLRQNGYDLDQKFVEAIAAECNQFAESTVEKAAPVLNQLAQDFPLVMVSNFYGNLKTVLRDFGINHYFNHIVESAVVGVRKPDSQIYQLGADKIGIPASQCVVIGDSYSKDIVPAKTLGCQAIWLNVKGWTEKEVLDENSPVADVIITDFGQTPETVRTMHLQMS